MRPPCTGSVGQGAITLPRPAAALPYGSRAVSFPALVMPTPAGPATDGGRVSTAP
ncbi:hypothetical protein [Streptomyces sp. SudanB182_2057]|uniref:hypothetical protein n=1 Tax=Streptomyces sp. SudanB182_2057 TaxID=3035281 RepID=UPI003F57BDBD